jgi:hypothetical protein
MTANSAKFAFDKVYSLKLAKLAILKRLDGQITANTVDLF